MALLMATSDGSPNGDSVVQILHALYLHTIYSNTMAKNRIGREYYHSNQNMQVSQYDPWYNT